MKPVEVLVVGGGHNGLVAAILAAGAGHRVTLLERSGHLGGATVGQTVFPGRAARLSRYAYLVSLMPEELVRRLGIELPLISRSVSSYTPLHRDSVATGLLVERVPGPATEASFLAVTGSRADYAAWQQLYGEIAKMAAVVAPVLQGPLLRRSEVRRRVIEAAGEQLWTDLFEAPIGEMITRRFRDDAVRGIVATDALIGTYSSLFDSSLLANRCFLYHLVGRGTGEWLVPVGGMGALSDTLAARALALGVSIELGTEVTQVWENGDEVTVLTRRPGTTNTGGPNSGGAQQWRAGYVLAAVAPVVVQGWLGRDTAAPVGAQIKINMLLNRLPRLVSGIDPAIAFAGTTHLEEGFEELEAAYRQTSTGRIPRTVPAEVYCHSLTDASVLGGMSGATLTLFGLHTPTALFEADPERIKAQVAAAALASLQKHLAEPLEDCLAEDSNGVPCVDIASPLDLESSLGMPGGNIFHGDLSWPWLTDEDPAQTAAQRYGVEVNGTSRILLAGAGSRRGGGVSGLGGAAAVDALPTGSG